MSSTITALTSGGGLSLAGDTSGVLELKSANGTYTATLPSATGTVAVADSSGNLSVTGNLSFNSGYGSSAVAYGCRAWVNFNGTGTVAIRASGNVSSITDNGTGDYTVNFTTAMPDANYAPVCMTQNTDSNGNRGAGNAQIYDAVNPTTSALRIFTAYGATASSDGSKNDQPYVCVSIFR